MKNVIEKSYALLLLLFLFSIKANAQNVTIGSGITVSLSSTNIKLGGNWVDNGTLDGGTGTVVFDGASGTQTITNSSGETFYNMTVNKASGDVQLLDSMTVNGTLTLTSGGIDLNGKVITLGSSALLSETAGNTVKGTSGYITTTRTINAPSSDNIAGFGAEITSGANLGSTVIKRGHAAQTANSDAGITRYFDITPTNDTGLNATLVFHYDNSELNGITATNLELFRSTDGGSTWNAEGGTVNTTNNTVTLSGINAFSRWTLAGSSSPLPVELSSLSASLNEGSVTLKWQTATEVNNHGFEVQRKNTSNTLLSGSVQNDWAKIGFVKGAGNSNSPKNYSFTDQPTGGTSFSYRIKQIDNNGTFAYFDTINVKLNAKTQAELLGNYPNPFNPTTNIKFYIPKTENVTIKIYDILGREVSTLFNKQTDAGYHIIYWNGKNRYGEQTASGVYIYRLIAGSYTQTKKMLMMK